MSTISALSTSTYESPLQRLQQELQSEVSDGTVSSSDADALSSALTDIDTALQQSRASEQSSGTKPSKEEMQSKIDDLIAGEVSSGKLTSDQADELKGVFKAAFADGPGGAGGPSDDGASPASSSTDASSTDSTTEQILQQFLQALQQSMSSSNSTYGSSGSASSSSSGTQISALLIDYTT